MARFNAQEADNYGNNGGAGFFGLKNHKDTAVIRFMYNTIEDVEGFSVHEIEVEGKKRYVNCLRDYKDPVDVCPLCAAGAKVHAKLFLHVFDEEEGVVKTWDRGKKFFDKIASLCTRYNPLVSTPFEIERNGKPNDTKTTYETFAQATDDITLEDLPEVEEFLGTLILDKTAEELDFFLDNGYFEDDSEEEEEAAPVTRRGAPERNPEKDKRGTAPAAAPQRRTPSAAAQTPASTSQRRTPATAGRGTGRGDKF